MSTTTETAVPGTIVNTGALVSPGGAQGIQGAAGPVVVSADAGNTATIGSDAKIYVPVSGIPTGSIINFGGSSAPTGFLLCDGTAVSRTTYSALFVVLSTTFGVGDGSTTFNLPDLRGRVSVGMGQGASLTNRALAATGGEEAHVLTVAELASHGHGVNESAHNHSQNAHGHTCGQVINWAQSGLSAGTNQILFTLNGGSTQYWNGNAVNNTATNNATTTGLTVATNGSGAAHQNMPPFVVLNKIIKI